MSIAVDWDVKKQTKPKTDCLGQWPIGLRPIWQATTVVPTKSNSDVIPCLQLLSKAITCTLHLS